MGFLDFFRTRKIIPSTKSYTAWKEMGKYTSQFYSFGRDIYASDIVRSCIRPLADHTSKANAVCTNKEIERLLNVRPNMYMNGPSFLRKVRTKLEINNTAFIYIQRDDKGHASGFYPVPYNSFSALEYANGLFIRFEFNGQNEPIVLPWEDIVVLRRDYNNSDIAGDDNAAILNELEIIATTNQGISNAIKATANLRGILKSTKGMLSDEDRKKQKDIFVKEYLSLENEGGIASLDGTQEFTPITMNPTVTNWETSKELRENVYRYFGVSDNIIMAKYTEAEMEAFYEARIEPFLVELSTELTKKVFTEREIGFGNQIVYESNRIQYCSTKTKLDLVQMVDRGALTPNEWRAVFNLAPVEGGDMPIRRLDTAVVEEKENENEE